MKVDGFEEKTDEEAEVQGEVQGVPGCKETVNRKLDLKLSKSHAVHRNLLPSDQMELDLKETQGARAKLHCQSLGFEGDD